MKYDTISRIAYLSGKYQFLADSCTSTKKKRHTAKSAMTRWICWILRVPTMQSKMKKFYKDLKRHISRTE